MKRRNFLGGAFASIPAFFLSHRASDTNQLKEVQMEGRVLREPPELPPREAKTNQIDIWSWNEARLGIPVPPPVPCAGRDNHPDWAVGLPANFVRQGDDDFAFTACYTNRALFVQILKISTPDQIVECVRRLDEYVERWPGYWKRRRHYWGLSWRDDWWKEHLRDAAREAIQCKSSEVGWDYRCKYRDCGPGVCDKYATCDSRSCMILQDLAEGSDRPVVTEPPARFVEEGG